MKKNLMVVVLLLTSTVIFAQHHSPDPKAMADKRSDKMKTELALNQDQYSKVKAINQKFAERHVALRKDTSLTVGTVRNQMKKLKTDQEGQLKNVLTAEQWTKWTALKSKKMDERKKHHPGHGKTDKG